MSVQIQLPTWPLTSFEPPTSNRTSLFPAHLTDFTTTKTEHWLAKEREEDEDCTMNNNIIITDAANVDIGGNNIMAPVLKTTATEYWLCRRQFNNADDNGQRPPVNERVPDPSLSLWLAAAAVPNHPAGIKKPAAATTAEEISAGGVGSSSPAKKARIEWPKSITDTDVGDWLVVVNHHHHQGSFGPTTTNQSSINIDLNKCGNENSDADIWLAKIDNLWISKTNNQSETSRKQDTSNVEKWLAKAIEDVTLVDDDDEDDDNDTGCCSSIEVIDQDLEEDFGDDDEILGKWLLS